MSIYELYGRLMEERHRESEEHHKTLRLLLDLKEGKIDLDRVIVTADGWKILTPEQASGLKKKLARVLDERIAAAEASANGQVQQG